MRVDAAGVRARADALQREYDAMPSAATSGAFAGVEIPLPHARWLFERRASEVFLRLWREQAHALCVEVVAARTAALDARAPGGADGGGGGASDDDGGDGDDGDDGGRCLFSSRLGELSP